MSLTPKVYHAKMHGIDNTMIHPDVLDVMRHLLESSYTTYLVGGSVRDLVLKKTPKDFDVVTSAKPDEIRRLFRRSSIIGKRFPIVHVYTPNITIEVTTFRKEDPNSDQFIVQDTNWGKPEEDVIKRDFSINGLFYDIEKYQIIDYINGYKDLSDGIIRSIGNPVDKFKQDPIRILRLIKLISHLKFTVAKDDAAAINECKMFLGRCSRARILTLIMCIMDSGFFAEFVSKLQQYNLVSTIFQGARSADLSFCIKRIIPWLRTIDYFSRKKRPLEKTIIFAGMFLSCINIHQHRSRESIAAALREAQYAIIHTTAINIPKKIIKEAATLVITQYLLEKMKLNGSGLLRQMRYWIKPALELMEARCMNDKRLLPTLSHWSQKSSQAHSKLHKKYHRSKRSRS